jgi:hypothetical protein
VNRRWISPLGLAQGLSIVIVLVAGGPTAAAAPGWSLETVDTVGQVGFSDSLAYSPTTGFPSIAYSDETNDDVKLATWNGASWSIQTVDAGKYVDGNISLAFDPAGNPSLSYGVALGQLKFARWTGSAWSIAVVDRDSPTSTSLVYSGGQPSIAYTAKSSVRLARYNGSAWSVETVEGKGNDSFSYASLAYAPDGGPSIAYKKNGSVDSLKFAHKAGASWSIQVIESGTYFGIFASLAYDPLTGYPAIVHSNGRLTNLRFLRFDGSRWNLEIVATGQASYSSLAYDAAGLAAISYQFAPGAGPYEELHLARRTGCSGTCWQDELIEDATPVQLGWRPSLAFAPTSYPGVAYSYGAGVNDLRFAQQTP